MMNKNGEFFEGEMSTFIKSYARGVQRRQGWTKEIATQNATAVWNDLVAQRRSVQKKE